MNTQDVRQQNILECDKNKQKIIGRCAISIKEPSPVMNPYKTLAALTSRIVLITKASIERQITCTASKPAPAAIK